MQCVGVVSVMYQVVGHLLCVASGAAEDDGVYVGAVVGDAFEGEIFVARVDHIVDMPHVRRPLVAGAYHELHRIVHVVFRDLGYLRGHGSREKQHLAVFRHIGEYVVYGVEESHVEHLVGFVEDHSVYLSELHHSPVDEVEKAPRCGHDYLHAFLEGAYLALDA